MEPGGFTEYNEHRARKEIVHSLCYLLFAIQLVKTGRIEDYSAANHYLADILSQDTQWSESEQQPLADRDNNREGKGRRGIKRFCPAGEAEDADSRRRWEAVVRRFEPVFESLRQELKDLRDYDHLYGCIQTQKMLYSSLVDRRRTKTPRATETIQSVESYPPGEAGQTILASVRFLRNQSCALLS